MAITPILSSERIERMRAAGYWTDRTLVQCLDDAAAAAPDKAAIADKSNGTTLTYQSLQERVDRIAANLARHGIGHGDVVSFQLPNWWHMSALHLACLRLGAISNPLMATLRERELRFILGHAESKALVLPTRFRGFDHAAMIAGLRHELPRLEHVFVVGGQKSKDGVYDFDEALLAQCPRVATNLSPNDVIQILYTSGTTGEPKGVMHTSNTLVSHVMAVTERLGLSDRDAILVGTPMAHQMGFLWGLIMPVVLGAKAVLQDVWDPGVALKHIAEEHVTFSMGATPFLADLVDHPDVGEAAGKLRMFLTGGAPIPRSLSRRAFDRLGTKVIAVWGMTENGSVTMTRPQDPEEKVFETDGCPMPGMEIRVVDAEGRVLPSGQDGHLQCRGPNNFVGYLKRPELYDVDAEGWFATGDLARIDADEYVRITGRAKDMIIRGGENIPVIEVESLLLSHPAIEKAAIAAMPDPRLGERACAFVTLRPGGRFDIVEMRRYLSEHRMTRSYWPERVEIVGEMPMTASGKIQKVRLREIAKNLAPQ